MNTAGDDMKKPKLPKFESIDELAEFWQSHDLTEFEDELEEVTEPVFVDVGLHNLNNPASEDMTTLTIELSKGLGEWLDFEVRTGNHRSACEYIRNLIEQAYRESVEAKLHEARRQLERGERRELTREDWDQLKAEYNEHFEIS